MQPSSKRPFVRPVFLVLLACATIFTLVVFRFGPIKAFFISFKVREELAPAMAAGHFEWGSPVFIRIFKEQKQLEVWMKRGDAFALFASYPVCDYSGGLGPKLSEGDRQAPEGIYAISPAMMNPNSAFHLAFNLGFPNAYDRAQQRTGRDLMVHGSCASVGCYAMTDAGIEKIYALMKAAFDAGQPTIQVDIFPFPLTPGNLKAHPSKWSAWWASLEPVYDSFEKTHQIPDVDVRDGHYALIPAKK